jgi:putative transposase
MPNYRRLYVPGGTVFLTITTYKRIPLFRESCTVDRLREAIAAVIKELPFEFVAAVVLPDHLHFIWTMPANDSGYSKRVGRMKVEFTKSLRGARSLPENVSASRRKHRESDVWQRRFYDHMIRDDQDFEDHLHYIHYNPVKHGLVTCPHLWPHSSFRKWVDRGVYANEWACVCNGRTCTLPEWGDLVGQAEHEDDG